MIALVPHGKLRCLGRDGKSRDFYYRYSVTDHACEEYHLNIFASENCDDGDFFGIVARRIDDSTIKIVSIEKNDDQLYGAKGIPDSALPKLKSLSGLTVVSSSRANANDLSERRTCSATKYWDRLVSKGLAEYDSENDRYRLIK